MFAEIRAKLAGIDRICDQEFLDWRNARDIEDGLFDPERTYNAAEAARVRGSGINSLKINGGWAVYIILDLKLEAEGRVYKDTFLRGFERESIAHPAEAEVFLSDVTKNVGEDFEFPFDWPNDGSLVGRKYFRDSPADNGEGAVITVSCVGGGRYTLKDQSINLFGESHAFGRIPQSHNLFLRGALGILVQTEPFYGFDIKY